MYIHKVNRASVQRVQLVVVEIWTDDIIKASVISQSPQGAVMDTSVQWEWRWI